MVPNGGSSRRIIMAYIVNNETTIVDALGNQIDIGGFNELKIAEYTTQISTTFNKPLNEHREVKIEGDVISQFNRSLLKVTGEAGGISSCTTFEHMRYRTAQTIGCYFTASWSKVPDVGDSAYIGIFDQYDGVYIGYDGADFIVAYRNIYADNGVGSQADAIQVVDVTGIDLSLVHRFRIKFGYLGVGNISIEIKTNGDWELLHKFQTDGALSERTHIGNAILPVRAEVNSTDTALYLLSGSWNAGTYGNNHNFHNEPFYAQGDKSLSVNSGEEKPLFMLRSKTIFGGFPSNIRSNLLHSEIGTGSEGLYRLNFYLTDSNITGATWTDVDTDHSVMEVSDNLDAMPANSLRLIYSQLLPVSSAGSSRAASTAYFTELKAYMNPGDALIVSKECLIQGAGDDTTVWSIAWEDLF